MDRPLLALPVELQVFIFNNLADLDDARSLSNTCRLFRALYTTYQTPIKRVIITRSPVYQYDLCLSNLLHAWEDAVKVLHDHRGNAPDELRLSGSVCLDCFDKDYTDTPLTNVQVDEISKRWWKLGILRDLYLNEAISRDFEEYRIEMVENTEYQSIHGSRPIIEESLELAINGHPNLEHAPDFKARFYQSLCLHSIALATRSHAVHSRDQSQMTNDPLNLIGERLYYIAGALWDKLYVVLNGRSVDLSHHVRFDCLEIYDFLYYFLLGKVVPFSALESWTADAADRYPYSMFDGDRPDNWNSLLDYCRLTLQPSDIVDLVKHQTWRAESNFPADRTNYMCERGLFDVGGHGAADFFSGFERWSMIDQAPHGLGSLSDFLDENNSHSWDELRVKLGSPFWSRFWQMLDLRASTADPAEAPPENLISCHYALPMMAEPEALKDFINSPEVAPLNSVGIAKSEAHDDISKSEVLYDADDHDLSSGLAHQRCS